MKNTKMSSLQKTAADATWNKFHELLLNPYAIQRYYAIKNNAGLSNKDAWKKLSKARGTKCISERM